MTPAAARQAAMAPPSTAKPLGPGTGAAGDRASLRLNLPAGEQRPPGFHRDRLRGADGHAATSVDKRIAQATEAVRARPETGLHDMATDALQRGRCGTSHVIAVALAGDGRRSAGRDRECIAVRLWVAS